MLTKVFPTGEGWGYGPVEYLCAVNPFGKGERKKAPKVISGDPELIRRQIDAVPFKFKYTSGVHSFAPEDTPTEEQIMEVIEATEELAFAGLPTSSRSILWVKHEHTGRTELHFLIPRQEVNSGKSFNAFPPRWQQKYDLLRDKFNYKYGWARPDDSERARHWQPGINAKILADAKRKKKHNPKAKAFSLIDDLANMAIQGNLANRLDIMSELRRHGYGISRKGKDYLTIVDEEGKRTRLKGTLFAENFNGPEWIKVELAKFNKLNSEKILIDNKLAAEAEARLQDAIRKTAQYNFNRYSREEKENEQCSGKQPIDKSKNNQGNLGSGNEGYSGKSAFLQEPANREANESNARYTEQGLGPSQTSGYRSTEREDVDSALRENPLSDSSPSSVGRTVGAGSEMAESHRRTVEHFHGWSNKNSQDSVGASSGDYRGQPGKPGGYDEADNGQPERVARQVIQSGELVQKIRSLKKGSEKLEHRLNRHQPDKQLPDFELGLRPALENVAKIAGVANSVLRLANETRSLCRLVNQSSSIAKIDIGNLLITCDETVKWLQAAKEQKLLQKLAKFESPLILHNLDGLSFQTEVAQHDLGDIFGTSSLARISNDLSSHHIDDLERLEQESKTVIHTLCKTADIRQLEYLKRKTENLALPSFGNLAVQGKIGCELLRSISDLKIMKHVSRPNHLRIIPDIARFEIRSRFVAKRLKTVHETRILRKIFKSEMNRRKIIKNCYIHAEWAGSDLRRWDKVFAQYGQFPKKRKILMGLIEEAGSRFLEILSETRNLQEIEERCTVNPFWVREFVVLLEILEEQSRIVHDGQEEQKEDVEINKISSTGPK